MVSEGYLRPWANRGGQVDVIDLQFGRSFTTVTKNATVVGGVYDPAVMTFDLEQHFGQIESDGIPSLVKLRNGHDLSITEKYFVVAFLDMHLRRGLYANQVGLFNEALVLSSDLSAANAQLNVADRMILAPFMEGSPRLTDRGLENATWQVVTGSGLLTGDGAVHIWDDGTEAVSFPLSPTSLLVIGTAQTSTDLSNLATVNRSRRWLVGEVGSLKHVADLLRATGTIRPAQDNRGRGS